MRAWVETYIGAGGKTTTIYQRAKRASKAGQKVAIVTTTHMWRPRENFLPGFSLSCLQKFWQAGQFAVLGRPCPGGKITFPGQEAYQELCQLADLVLVEGDGSRQLPLKIMGKNEPCIPQNTTIVYCLAGLTALGQRLGQACFRAEAVPLAPETLIDTTLFSQLVEKGCLKKLGPWQKKTTVLLNQADDAARIKAGKQILTFLSRPGRLTSYRQLL